MELAKVSAVVSGGASGLGAATARCLVAAGAQVVILDRDGDRAAQLATELGAGAAAIAGDVTDAAAVQAAIDAAGQRGPLRVAVSCAGVGWAARTVDRQGQPHDLELFQKIISVNLVGTFNLLRLAAAAMSRTPAGPAGERGVIVSTASIAAFDGQIGQIAYAASKAGVAGMTLPAARDLAPAGIRVVTIAPGIFDTPMVAGLSPEARQALAASVVCPGRLGQPAEYGALVVHICQNEYLNGETIRLDGALRMAPK